MYYNLCTLFDKNYLYRGLALHNSLSRYCPNFKLWILCMDEITYDALKKRNLEKAELISLKEFEDPELLKIKPTRTQVEYCWTCTSSLLLYLFKRYPNLENITYLDADLFFYSDPKPIYDEFGENSIMIISHRYSPEKKFLEKEMGIYNVSMVIFRNDQKALECLKWWRERCLEWCFHRIEDGKLGDQNYLNDWPERFPGVYVLKHKGANLAPWNIKNYEIKLINNQIFVNEDLLIFYHFHSLKMYSPSKFQLYDSGYGIERYIRDLIYRPYLDELAREIKEVKKLIPDFSYGFSSEPDLRQRTVSLIKKLLKFIPILHPTYYWFKHKFMDKRK